MLLTFNSGLLFVAFMQGAFQHFFQYITVERGERWRGVDRGKRWRRKRSGDGREVEREKEGERRDFERVKIR